MSLRQMKNNLFSTFRAKLAMQLALLVSVALVITFLLAFWMIQLFFQAKAQNQLKRVLQETQSAYLGVKIPEVQVQLPEPLLQRIKKSFPNIFLGVVEKEKGSSGWVYEMLASTGKERLEILAEPQGDIWVAQRISIQEVYKETSERVFLDLPSASLFLFSAEGSLLAHPSNYFPPVPLKSLLENDSFSFDETFLQKNEKGWVAVAKLYDGNFLYLAYQDRLTPRLLRYGFFLLMLLLAFFVPVAFWIGNYIARRAMAGVERVTRAAEQVEAGDFTERVDLGKEGREIEELAQAFNAMVARTEVLMRELRDLSVNIAHDLRTPIARIRSLLEHADWAEIPAEQRQELAGTAIEECDRLVLLINDVLEIAQAKSGQLGLHCESLNLSEEAERVVELFSALAEEKQINLSVSLPENPLLLRGDQGRIQRILANLLDNAIKYTPEGGRVELRIFQKNKGACLEIQDTGIGIPEADYQRVFERFYRGELGRSRSGNGLGLNLVQAFVSAHGGCLELESPAEGGCLVRVCLPLDPLQKIDEACG